MRIKRIKVRDFKGLHSLDMQLDCEDAFIFGRNASGKTTVADAVSWLLFNKDSAGRATFEIKPIGKVGTAIAPVECEVEATFVNGDTEVTLKKIYKEKFTKKRGSLESEMTGHTTEYFVNSVPVKESEYKAKVAEVAVREDLFRLITSPTYFCEQLHWGKRREMLFDISAKLTDADIIAAHPELTDLPTVLGNHRPDDYKKIVMGQRKAIKEQIESIPARIDEVLRSKPTIEGNNSQAIIKRLTKLREELGAKQQEITTMQAGGGLSQLRLKLAEQDIVIQQITSQSAEANRAATQALKDELSAKKDEAAAKRRSLQSHTSAIGLAEAELKLQSETRESLLAEYKRLVSEKFTPGACPTCGQAMTEVMAAEAIQNFNINLAKAKEINITKGVACKQRIVALTMTVEIASSGIAAETAAISEIEAAIVLLNEKIVAATPGHTDKFAVEINKAMETRAAIVKQIDDASAGSTAAVDKLNTELAAINNAIIEQEQAMARIEQALAADTRSSELKADEERLSREFAETERHLYLIETFIRAKVSALTDAINSKFKLVKFQLFKDQINGGVEEICEATVGGVPYNGLNHAAKIQAGLDIINTFSEHYGFYPVIFVDGRESVTELPPMKAQVISLVVSPEDKELRWLPAVHCEAVE